MQREILFKAKRKDNGEWVEGSLVTYPNDVYEIWDIKMGRCCLSTKHFKVIPKTVSQYTGLNDKYGDKIFENDIIRLDDDYRKLISFAGAKTEEDLVRKDCLVGFKDGNFMFCRNRYVIDDFDSYLWLSNEHCEAIGNIFDEEVK